MLFISISQNSGHSELESFATQERAGVHRGPREPARYNFCGQCWTLKLELLWMLVLCSVRTGSGKSQTCFSAGQGSSSSFTRPTNQQKFAL